MMEHEFPYPLGAKKVTEITKDEEIDILAALDAGWKEFCKERHDILGMRAKRAAGPSRQWDLLSAEQKHAKLLAGGVDVPVEWVEEGWPYHGIMSKLTKFTGQLTRCGYAVLTAGFTQERQAELFKQLHLVERIDNAYLAAAKDVHNQIQRLMSNAPQPKTKAELVLAIDAPVDTDYYVGKYMEATVNKETPTWKEFAAKFEVAQPPAPKEPVGEPTVPEKP